MSSLRIRLIHSLQKECIRALAHSEEYVAHYAVSDLAGNFGGHGIEFLLSVFMLLLLFRQ